MVVTKEQRNGNRVAQVGCHSPAALPAITRQRLAFLRRDASRSLAARVRLGYAGAMKLTLLYFAHLAERTGTREETRDVPDGTTTRELPALLAEAHPKLGDTLQSCRIAVDEEFASGDTTLKDGQTIAFIPPVSGG
jgi:molybdopterin converting factor subunit 1